MANTGGKHLFDTPLSFEDESVNVGDLHTTNSGTHATVVGPSCSNTHDRAVVIGRSNSCTGAGADSVNIGSSVRIGDFHSLGLPLTGIAVGKSLDVDHSVVVGTHDAYNGVYPPYSVYVGWLQHVGTGGDSHVNIGYATSFGDACTRCTLVGALSVLTPVAPATLQSVVVFGDVNAVTGPYSSETFVAGSSNTVTSTTKASVVGQHNTLAAINSSGYVVVGSYNDVGLCSSSTVVGQFITVEAGTQSVAIGYLFTAESSVVVGNPLGGVNDVYPAGSVYVGLSLDVGAGGSGNVVVGNDVKTADDSSASTVVGPSNSLTFTLSTSSVTVVGDSNVLEGQDCSNSIVQGSHNEVTDTLSCTVVGNYNVVDTTGDAGFVVVGSHHDVQVTGPSTVIGQFITLTAGWSIAIGYSIEASASIVIGNPLGGGNDVYPAGSVYVGLSLNVGAGGSANAVFGNSLTLGTNGTSCVVVGNTASLGNDCDRCTVVGHGSSAGATVTFCTVVDGSAGAGATSCVSIGGTLAAAANHAVCVGRASSAAGSGTSVGGSTNAANLSVALGYLANASTAHTMEVGAGSDPDLDLGVNVFTVRGSQGVSPTITNLLTVQATTSPASGDVGLVVTYNDGATISNKTVRGSVSPPVGSLLLYVDP